MPRPTGNGLEMDGRKRNGGEAGRELARERMVLERILALLLSLAALAERATGASPRRRRRVAGFLSVALAEARDMIARLAGLRPDPAAGPPCPAPCPDHTAGAYASADGMRRLAAALRALALVLHALLERARRGGPQSPILRAWMKASCGISTLPNCRMRFLPSFCFSSSLRLRVTSPP